MKIKFIAILFTLSLSFPLLSWFEKPKAAGVAGVEKLDEVLEKRIDHAEEAAKEVVDHAGEAVGVFAAMLSAAAKGAVIAAGPYVIGGVVVGAAGYGMYKYYESCQPSVEKAEKSLNECLRKAKELNQCEKMLKDFAIMAGVEKAKEKEAAFNAYS